MDDSAKPLVSICCITYNHEKFIAEALDSFLMQQVAFEYEIVIGEDGSTDGTRKICEDYQRQYPDKIRLLPFTDNMGALKNVIKTLEAGKGKYIAFCEGDDYWTEHLKLQKQVDILEENPGYSMVFSDRKIVNENGEELGESNYTKEVYSLKDIINGFIPATQTIVFRNNKTLVNFFSFQQGIYSGDRFLSYFCAQFGNIYRLSEVTAAYRDSGSGVWSKYSAIEKLKLREKHLYDFHESVGVCIDDPQFAIKSFENFIELLIIGIRKPSCFFDRNFNNILWMIWKKYRFMNRFKLLRTVLAYKFKKKFKGNSI